MSPSLPLPGDRPAKRIQLRRTKGWRKPADAIVVARPSKWGNPFSIQACWEAGFADTEEAARTIVVDCYRDWLLNGKASDWWFFNGSDQWEYQSSHLADLAGRDLACWCPPDVPCHADVLLEVANRDR